MAFDLRPSNLATTIFLFIALLLLLLVSLSAPVIKSIYILEIKAKAREGVPITSIATQVRFGLWGWCAGAYQFGAKGPTFVNNAICTHPPRLGYDVDPILLNLTGQPALAEAVVKGLTYVLVLHPIACALTFITFLVSLLVTLRPSTVHAIPILTLLLNIIPTVLTAIVWAIDVALILISRGRVKDATNGSLSVNWGNGTWMTFGAFIAHLGAIIGLSIASCYCCGYGSGTRRLRRNTVKGDDSNEKRTPA